MARPKLQLVVFDFDQTLSACHLHHTLAGGEGGIKIPPPFARSERGQLARLAELDDCEPYCETGGFAVSAFGGGPRVAELRSLLDELREADVECCICSRGLVGPIRRSLDQIGLLDHFSEIFANSTATNVTEYDQRLPADAVSDEDLSYLAGEGYPRWGPSKGRLVKRLLRERGLRQDEAVFVDDTLSEIHTVQGTCFTIHVQASAGQANGEGMREREFTLLRRLLAGLPIPNTGSAASRTAPALRLARPGASPGGGEAGGSPRQGPLGAARPSLQGRTELAREVSPQIGGLRAGGGDGGGGRTVLQPPRRRAEPRPASEGAMRTQQPTGENTLSNAARSRLPPTSTIPASRLQPPPRLQIGRGTGAAGARAAGGAPQDVARSEGLPSPRSMSPADSDWVHQQSRASATGSATGSTNVPRVQQPWYGLEDEEDDYLASPATSPVPASEEGRARSPVSVATTPQGVVLQVPRSPATSPPASERSSASQQRSPDPHRFIWAEQQPPPPPPPQQQQQQLQQQPSHTVAGLQGPASAESSPSRPRASLRFVGVGSQGEGGPPEQSRLLAANSVRTAVPTIEGQRSNPDLLR